MNCSTCGLQNWANIERAREIVENAIAAADKKAMERVLAEEAERIARNDVVPEK
jgi:hypothetical protein